MQLWARVRRDGCETPWLGCISWITGLGRGAERTTHALALLQPVLCFLDTLRWESGR